MKKITTTILFLLAVVLPCLVSAEPVVVKVKETGLNADPQGEILGTLKEGATADKIEEKEGWTRIRLEGWVQNSDLLVMKTEKADSKDYRELSANKLAGMIETYYDKKISFKGRFGMILKMDDRVNNYTRFTVSLVECYIRTGDFDSIKDLKDGDQVTVYGKVKRGLGYPEWYYVAVDKITRN